MISKVFFQNFNKHTFTFQKSDYKTKSDLEKSPHTDSFEMSVGYVNDIHGQTNNMMRILSGLKGDLRLSAGDNDIGDEKNKAVHKATAKFLNLAGVKASALGNHEFDTTQKDFVDTLKYYNGDMLSVNLKKQISDISAEDSTQADIDKHIKKAIVINVKGEKVGLIGASPVDMFERATHPDYHKDRYVDSLEDTLEDIQEEIDDLREQGVNKIFLLSHLGNKRDKYIAENTKGLDVIIGGHTHELLKGIVDGENLLTSKDGEPVIITQAGRDGKSFGLLNLTFNNNGIITKAQNNLAETSLFYRKLSDQYVFDKVLGKPEKVGYIKSAPMPPETLIEENPHANFMCDAMRYELNADIAVWNNAGPRNFFHEGVIDSRDVKDIAPFRDGVSVANVTEKKFVEWVREIIEKSYKTPGYKPGLLAVSGLKYTVDSKAGKLSAMSFIDKEGSEHIIDINNPSDVKTYKIAADSFLMSAGADHGVLAKKEDCINYTECKDYFTCEYIKHLGGTIDINQTGRIEFI